MQTLDLYAKIEKYLDFKEEVTYLHETIKNIVLQIEPKSHIDIGCGQGDFCLNISNNGIKSFGVDLSCEQVKIAKEKGVDAKCIDIKDIAEKYDCATAVFDVINYLPKEYIKEFLKNTHNLLNKDGYFVFDVNSLFGFEEVAPGTLTIDLDDKFIAIDAIFEENILYTDITLFEQNGELYKKNSGTIEQYYYCKDELSKILKDVGFTVETVVGINLHDFDENDKEIYICKKD